MGRVHIAITRRVKPGREREFEAALREFARESLHEPGTMGVQLIGPLPGAADGEYGILRSFESDDASRAFYASERFAEWQRRVAPLVDAEYESRRLHGLEEFFREVAGNPPPRWKMAVVTWLGVFPSVLLWSSLLVGPPAGIEHLARLAAVNVLVVFTLTWGVMPLLTKWFARWLRARDRG